MHETSPHQRHTPWRFHLSLSLCNLISGCTAIPCGGRRHPPSIANLPRPRPQAYNALGERRRLLELDLAANGLDLALDVIAIVLGGIRLDLDRRLLDHLLRLLQAEARDAAHDLEDRDLLVRRDVRVVVPASALVSMNNHHA